jgi:sulfite oxidase
LDRCTEEGEVTPFGGSIPLAKALAPEVPRADEMNGEPLAPAHGYPLRVVVPGYIGARSVKWLATIAVQDQPSTNYFQARTYRLYPSRVRSETTPGQGFSLGETPVNSAICQPAQGAVINGPRVLARGYALTGGTREIERVETSLDQVATFTTAAILDGHRPCGWRLWETELALGPGVHELAVRAWDSAASTRPESPEGIWNLKGYLNNAWHRVRFTVTSQQTHLTMPASRSPPDPGCADDPIVGNRHAVYARSRASSRRPRPHCWSGREAALSRRARRGLQPPSGAEDRILGRQFCFLTNHRVRSGRTPA